MFLNTARETFQGLNARFARLQTKRFSRQFSTVRKHPKLFPKFYAGTQMKRVSVVILETQVCYQVLAAKVAQSILELHQLNKDVMFGVEMWGRLR